MLSSEASEPSQVLPNVIVTRRDNVISCDVADETVLLDLDSSMYFGLDPVGSRIWALLDAPRRLCDLRDELVKEFDVDAPTCGKAVLQFAGQMMAKGLVEMTEP